MFESTTTKNIKKCPFCKATDKHLIVMDAFGNKFKCEVCGKVFTAQEYKGV